MSTPDDSAQPVLDKIWETFARISAGSYAEVTGRAFSGEGAEKLVGSPTELVNIPNEALMPGITEKLVDELMSQWFRDQDASFRDYPTNAEFSGLRTRLIAGHIDAGMSASQAGHAAAAVILGLMIGLIRPAAKHWGKSPFYT